MLVCAQSLQLCPTLCDPMDWSLPGSSVHGVVEAKYWSRYCYALLQGTFLTWGSNLCLLHLLHCRWIPYPLTHLGSPYRVTDCNYKEMLKKEKGKSLMTIQGGRVGAEEYVRPKRASGGKFQELGWPFPLNWVLATGGSWNIPLTHTFMCHSVYVIFFIVKVIRKKKTLTVQKVR